MPVGGSMPILRWRGPCFSPLNLIPTSPIKLSQECKYSVVTATNMCNNKTTPLQKPAGRVPPKDKI
eukprot:scaffold62752_cov13-Tisochrysis_lutea.AAC.1